MTKEKNKKLVLLDSHAIIHRAYHALPDFASKTGEPTGALYGLVSMLIKIVDDLEPDYIVACYDVTEPTHRHDAYKDYKAGRKETDVELKMQLERSKDIFEAFNIPIYLKSGFEADDVIGTIVENLKKDKSVDVVIASGDMDTLQLVSNKKVRVYTLKKGIKDTIIYDEDLVKERFGFGPELLPDYKGLRGDPSDNIIGIPGIGEKSGSVLIQQFGTIENIYKTLKKDPEAFEKAGIKARTVELLKNGEEEAKFSKMLATIRRDAPIDFVIPEKSWRESFDMAKAKAIMSEFGFKSLIERMSQLVSGETVKEEKKEAAQASLGDRFGGISEEELYKVKLALWVLDSNISDPSIDDILSYAKTESFSEAREIILGDIQKNNLGRIYADIELPLIPIMKKMRERGIKIDKEYLEKISKDYHKKLDAIEKEIWRQAGAEFNVSSPKQLGEILFDKLGLVVKNQKKTGTGAKSTRESELEKMRELHPIIDNILQYREYSKLLSTYIDAIPKLLDDNNRLHTTLEQAGTTTGRMSSNNPNLQNIPIKTELGRNIRNAFIAEKGFKLVALDYSQIELRIAAFLSGDKKLIEIFKNKGDVHTAVAAEVFGVSPEKVDKEMRRRAKVINFGILYGMGINALKTNLGTSRDEAQKFYDEYFRTFKGIAEYVEHIKALAARQGYTETFYGRRRYFRDIQSKLPYIRAAAERMAVNAPIQGTEADILKIAQKQVDDLIESKKWGKDAFALLQVHDELIYEVKEKHVKEFAQEAQHILENVMTLEESSGVPIEVHVSAGDNWGEMGELL